MTAPKAFLCHATPDKDVYVQPFGEALAVHGIHAWVDTWEILPGDSLLTRIEAGIGEAGYFLPFLSERSLGRPWVRAEIEMAVTRRMLDRLRIIPLLIGVDVPELPLFLQTIRGVRIVGEAGIPAAAQEVADAIHGVSRRPVIHAQPAYTATPTVPGLSPADMAVLRAACERSVVVDQPEIDFDEIVDELAHAGLAAQTIRDSAAVLCEKGLLHAPGVPGNPFRYLEVRPRGFDVYATVFLPDYGTVYRRIAVAIASAPDYNPDVDAASISKALTIPHRIVNHVYEHLALRGKITLSDELSPSHEAVTVSASFRREMTDLADR
jgi:hypothetical protein